MSGEQRDDPAAWQADFYPDARRFPPAAHAGTAPLPHDRQAPALRPPPPDPEPVSPDCEVGKCTACTGGAWDERIDGPVLCRCKCH